MSKSKIVTFLVLTAQQHFFSIDNVDKVLNPGKTIDLPEDHEYVKSLEAQGFIKVKESSEEKENKEAITAKLREDIKAALAEVGVNPTEAELESYLKMNVIEFSQFVEGLRPKVTTGAGANTDPGKKDYSELKFGELQAEAEARGLGEKIKGMSSKKEIIAVLEADDQSKTNN